MIDFEPKSLKFLSEVRFCSDSDLTRSRSSERVVCPDFVGTQLLIHSFHREQNLQKSDVDFLNFGFIHL